MSVPPCWVGLDTDFSPFWLISCPQPGTLLDIQSLYCFSATKGWVLEDCRFYTQVHAASWVVTAIRPWLGQGMDQRLLPRREESSSSQEPYLLDSWLKLILSDPVIGEVGGVSRGCTFRFL